MSGEQITVGLILKADGKGLVGEVRLSEKELDKLGKTTKRAGRDAETGAKGVKRFGRESKTTTSEARRLNKQAKNLGQNFNTLRSAVVGLGLAALTRNIVNTSIAFDRIELSLKAATGSSELAAEEFAFVAQESDRLGLRLRDQGKAYAQLLASAKGTALQGQAIRDIFSALSEASIVLQLGSQRSGLAIFAVQQMISKGTVSMEELRRQMGDLIPGAFQIAARAMGVTTAELNKMVESGQLMAVDFLPRFAAEMSRTLGEAVPDAIKSSQAELGRFYNSLDDIKNDFGDGGFMDGFTDGIKELTRAMSDPGFRQGVREMGAFTGDLFKLLAEHGDIIVSLILGLKGAQAGAAFGGGLAGKRGAVVGGIAGGISGYFAGQTISDQFRSNDITAQLNTDYAFEDARARTFQGRGGGSFVPPPVGLGQKAIDGIKDLERERDSMERLLEARELGITAYEQTKALIEGENNARRLGINEQMAEYSTVVTLTQSIQSYARSLKLVGEIEKNNTKATREIETAFDRLPKTYNQARDAAYKWHTDVLAGLNKTKDGYFEFSRMADEVLRDQLSEAYRDSLETSEEWADGITRAYMKIEDRAFNLASQSENMFQRLDRTAEDSFVNMVKGTESVSDAFTNMADNILTEMLRISYQQSIAQPLLSGFQMLLGGIWGGGGNADASLGQQYQNVQYGHEGAVIGRASMRGAVPASIFADAPRHHKGTPALKPGEVPFIGMEGEIIGWPDQLARAFSGGKTEVTIIDNRGAEAPDIEVNRRSEGGVDLIDIVVPAIEQATDSGRLDASFGRNLGTRRQPVPGS